MVAGNDILAAMTAARPYTLRIDMVNMVGTGARVFYSHFVLGGANVSYQLVSVGNYIGTLGGGNNGKDKKCHAS